MALGRLVEALEPLKSALNLRERSERWVFVTGVAANLSDLEMTLGEMEAAERYAKKAVDLADRSGDDFQRAEYRAALADVLHQKGHRQKAQEYFVQAEAIQSTKRPESPLLHSRQGFLYCDLLLVESERASWWQILTLDSGALGSGWEDICYLIEVRAAWTLTLDKAHRSSLVILALAHLNLGRLAIFQALPQPNGSQRTAILEVARTLIVTSVVGLRAAGTIHELPRGLLSRSWQRSLTGPLTGPESAQADLDEAWEIAQRGPMPLFLADILLHRTRLFFREKTYPWPNTTAKADLAEARRLITKHGYWRRKEELEDAEAVIK